VAGPARPGHADPDRPRPAPPVTCVAEARTQYQPDRFWSQLDRVDLLIYDESGYHRHILQHNGDR